MLKLLRKKAEQMFRDKSFGEVLRGSALIFSSKILETVFIMGTSIFVARMYGAATVGVLTVIRTIFEILFIIGLAGLDFGLVRFIPEHKVKFSLNSSLQVFYKALKITTVAALALGLLLWAGAAPLSEYVFKKPYLTGFIAMSAIFLIPKIHFKVNLETFRGLKNFKMVASQNVGLAVLNFGVLVLLTFMFNNEYIPVYSYFATAVLAVLLSYFLIYTQFVAKVDKSGVIGQQSIRDILRISHPMFVTRSTFLIIGYSDVIMLTAMGTEVEVGIYNVAFKLIMFSKFFRESIVMTSGPKFSELYYSKKFNELSDVIMKTTRLLFYSMIPFLSVFIIFGKPILSLYGPEFTQGYYAMVFLAIAQMVRGFTGTVGVILNVADRQRLYRNIVMIGATLNIVLNFILIPKYGIAGAAFANMVATIFNDFIAFLVIKRSMGISTLYIPFFSERAMRLRAADE